jgi:hypothetical protein
MVPLMSRFCYDTGSGLRVMWDLGLSTAATKMPSRATVTFWIYSSSPKWGLRAAAQKFYQLNPSSFSSPLSMAGAWFPPRHRFVSERRPQLVGLRLGPGRSRRATSHTCTPTRSRDCTTGARPAGTSRSRAIRQPIHLRTRFCSRRFRTWRRRGPGRRWTGHPTRTSPRRS